MSVRPAPRTAPTGRFRRAGLAMAVTGVVALGACGGSSAPRNPTGMTTPTPAPTPSPTPTPTPTPVALTCNLSSRVDCGAACCRPGGSPLFDAEIRAAQDAVRLELPGMFNADGSVAVADAAYTAAVATRVTALFGLCAMGGNEEHSTADDEVAVKRDNKLSQNVDLILGSTRQPGIYNRFTCQPASF
jgi:hypothetical protein